MTDPFAPVPEDKAEQNRPNVYDDLLNQDAPTAKPKFDPDAAPPPSSAPARPLNPSVPQAPVQSAPVPRPEFIAPTVTPSVESPQKTPVVESKQEEFQATRRSADRQRSVAERGTLPQIKDTAQRTKSFPFLIVAIIVTALIVGGGIGAAVFYTLTNKSEVGTPVDVDKAMNDDTLPALNGLTGQKVLDLPRVEEVTKDLKKEASDFVDQIDFIGDFTVIDPAPMSIQDANGNDTPVFAAVSDTYTHDGNIDAEQKQKLIDLANNVLVAKGYSTFDVNNSGIEDPLNAPQLFIGGAKTSENGALMSYSITVNTTNGDESAGRAGVFITFYSSPHIKEGTEDAFKKFVTDSYNAKP